MSAAGPWVPNAKSVTAVCGFIMTLACVQMPGAKQDRERGQ